MFHYSKSQSGFAAAFSTLRLIFVTTARHIRKSNKSPIIGLLMNILKTLMLVAIFAMIMSILGMRSTAIRGDFILYVMTGVFLFRTHIGALSDVSAAPNGLSAMTLHAPMNTTIAVTSAALSNLFTQILSFVVVLSVYSLGWGAVHFQNLKGAFGMLLLAWASGASIGMVFLAAKPWAPSFISIFQVMYMRANMFTSGKMFVANAMPGYMLALFSWNPLFHTIDQARGFTFVNYNPHHSNYIYPIYFTLVFITIGLLGEFFTRKRISLSWMK
ncbi:ABC transporter permease [Celeribacter litoreus]|uniref:ABC transporter permease n=1 Tax=Celeribacter litoreus TaxID=2876714 RepID=UPI001CCF164B|nr:ABC transporter permease [Celeribacter litoreus]MCA0042092.1 ABC transporter permease [Celeribacter litoreus]